MDFTWLGIQICICWSQIPFFKKVGMWIRKPVSIWCDHLMQRDTCPSHRVEQAVDYDLWNCWILVGTGTCCRRCRPRASHTCSMGVMSGDYVGPGRTRTFSASRNCVQILAARGRALSCWNMTWWRQMNGTTNGPEDLIQVSLCIQIGIYKMHLCSLCLPIP